MSQVEIELIDCKFKDWMGWFNVYNHYDHSLTVFSPYGIKRVTEIQVCPLKSCKYEHLLEIEKIQTSIENLG